MNTQISLLYSTCDRYECLWNGFFRLWEKYWPDFDSKVILNTESKSFSFGKYNIVRPSFSKLNLTWSERIYESLLLVDTPYVLFTLDDFYIKSPVDVNTINMCIEQMNKDKSINLFTFGWQPGKNKACDFSDKFELRGRFAPYRVNAQIALWRVTYLKKIIKLYENPWEFELNGSFRSSIYGGKLYSLKKNTPLVFDYDWGFLVVRGQLNKEVSDYFSTKEKMEFDSTFSYIDMDAYRALGQQRSGNQLRKLRYLWRMIISLFKK